MPKKLHFNGERGEEVRLALRRLAKEHPGWSRSLLKREYRARRRAAQSPDWMVEEAARAKAKLTTVDGEIRRLAQEQEARRA